MKYIINILQRAPSDPKCFMPVKYNTINPADFVNVYTYESDDYNLEEIFEKFNINHPDDYHARSLSVSDLISVRNSDIGRKLYVVNAIGFKEVEIE